MPQDQAARLTDTQISEVIRHLETAEDNHRRWLRCLHQTLVCGGDFQDDVLDKLAHQRCRFGCWYYHNDIRLLQSHPDYLALEALHRAMHDGARKIAQLRQAGAPIPAAAYTAFMDGQQQFSETLLKLRDSLRECLYSFDSLTGLMRREPFLALLQGEVERSRRNGEQAVVALIDADHFKQVNDLYGHLAGDRVLRVLAQFFLQNLRRYDLICRYGGEEFLACLPNTGLDQAMPIMDRLREELMATDIAVNAPEPLRVTVSIGLAVLDPTQPVEEAISRADQALYAAKESGRNRVMCQTALT